MLPTTYQYHTTRESARRSVEFLSRKFPGLGQAEAYCFDLEFVSGKPPLL